MRLERASFSPEEMALMNAVFDAAVAQLPPTKGTAFEKLLLAERILRRAAAGERDPLRLLAAALITVADNPDDPPVLDVAMQQPAIKERN
jgi:hypothetical protein